MHRDLMGPTRPTVVVTPALLARFRPGPATLRVTGFGGQKLMQTPAPRTRELQVLLQPWTSIDEGAGAR